jgi:rhodanese-related sulfurtransferase
VPAITSIRIQAVRQAALLLALSLVPAALAAYLNPSVLSWTTDNPEIAGISLETALLARPPVLWVDARTDAEFARGHIAGAIPLNEDRWNALLGDFIAHWEQRPGQAVVVYCDPGHCNASREVARRLRRELQVDSVAVLSGDWKRAPVASPSR